jgi:hypothetical protein
MVTLYIIENACNLMLNESSLFLSPTYIGMPSQGLHSFYQYNMHTLSLSLSSNFLLGFTYQKNITFILHAFICAFRHGIHILKYLGLALTYMD